jgi:hypothetical protein
MQLSSDWLIAVSPFHHVGSVISSIGIAPVIFLSIGILALSHFLSL